MTPGQMTPGQIAYNAYGDAREWKTVSGTPMPKWNDQHRDLRDAWEIGATAVLHYGQPPNVPGKPVLCLDFDGVLHSYGSGWKGPCEIPDLPVPGAMEALLEYTEAFTVCIYSSRSKEPGGIDAMKAWIWFYMEWLLVPDTVDDDADEMEGEGLATRKRVQAAFASIHFPLAKPAAFFTIDDRALCFAGEFPPAAELKAFKPWNRKDV